VCVYIYTHIIFERKYNYNIKNLSSLVVVVELD
jgi:hypothetical protein